MIHSNIPQNAKFASSNGQGARTNTSTVGSRKRMIHPGTYDQVISLPDGKHLSDMLFNVPARSILTAGVSTGKTTMAVNWHGPSIIVVPTRTKADQLAAKYPKAAVYHGERKEAQGHEDLIITLPDSLPRVVKLIEKNGGGRGHYDLGIDESHCIATADYRRGAYTRVYREVIHPDWRRVTLLSGTPAELPCAELAKFYRIGVESSAPVIKACRVRQVNGSRFQAALSVMAPDGRYLWMLQNKNQDLDRAIESLVEAGYGRDQIGILNADERESALYRQVIGKGTVPDEIKVLITTSVIGEGVDLHERFDAVMLLSPIGTEEAQQIVGRARRGVGRVYWFNNADGTEGPFDEQVEIRLIRETAEDFAKTYRRSAKNDPRMTDGVLGHNRQVMAQLGGALLEWEKDHNGDWQPSVSTVGCANDLALRRKNHANRNPQVFMDEMTDRFGWEWGTEISYTHTADPDADEAVKERVKERVAERAADTEEQIEQIRVNGVEAPVWGDPSPKYRRLRKAAESYVEIIGDLDKACDALLLAGDSGRRINTVRRQMGYQMQRHDPSQNALILDFYRYVSVGEQLTPDEVCSRVALVCARWPMLSETIRIGSRGRRRLTKRAAVKILRDFFKLKRCKVTVNGQRMNAYEVVSDNPLEGIIP
jgi:hypothetical protein